MDIEIHKRTDKYDVWNSYSDFAHSSFETNKKKFEFVFTVVESRSSEGWPMIVSTFWSPMSSMTSISIGLLISSLIVPSNYMDVYPLI